LLLGETEMKMEGHRGLGMVLGKLCCRICVYENRKDVDCSLL